MAKKPAQTFLEHIQKTNSTFKKYSVSLIIMKMPNNHNEIFHTSSKKKNTRKGTFQMCSRLERQETNLWLRVHTVLLVEDQSSVPTTCNFRSW